MLESIVCIAKEIHRPVVYWKNEWRRQNEISAWLKQPIYVIERRLGLKHMLEDFNHHHDVICEPWVVSDDVRNDVRAARRIDID
jgi:hypothetical protein